MGSGTFDLPFGPEMLFRVLIGVCMFLTICGCVYVNVISLQEAFGTGPPYYGRTTNMDKWHNPIPFLAVLDLGLAGLICSLLWIRSKYLQGPPHK